MAHTAVEVEGDEPAALYRFYDVDGALLYVGITVNLARRWEDHAAEKAWWPRVARKTVVLYGSRKDALAAEAGAIIAEVPIHNVAGQVPSGGDRDVVLKRLERRLADAKRSLKAHTHQFDATIEGWIDDFARDRKCSHSDAVVQLLFDGMMKHYDDLSAAYEAERVELEACHATEAAGVAS